MQDIDDIDRKENEIKVIQEWFDNFKKSNSVGFCAFYVSKEGSGDNIALGTENIALLVTGMSTFLVGALEMMKTSLIDKIKDL